MNTDQLLRLDPTAAMRVIVSPMLTNPNYGQYLSFGTVTSINKDRSSVMVTMDRSIAPLECWKYSGTVDLVFNRMDIADLFTKIGGYTTLTPPFRVSDVFKQITDTYGYVFDKRDYMDTVITSDMGDEVLVRAGDDSLRWYGHYMLRIGGPV